MALASSAVPNLAAGIEAEGKRIITTAKTTMTRLRSITASIERTKRCVASGNLSDRGMPRGFKMPCLVPWRCREALPSQHRLLGHPQSQEKNPQRKLLQPSG